MREQYVRGMQRAIELLRECEENAVVNGAGGEPADIGRLIEIIEEDLKLGGGTHVQV